MKKLLFVYNETSNPLQLLLGVAHRVASPETYACKLCDVTYGMAFKKKAWKEFIAGLPYQSEFKLKDRFWSQHPALKSEEYPAVFLQIDEGEPTLVIPAADINQCENLGDLMTLVSKKVSPKFPS